MSKDINASTGVVFDIQKFTVHDGPGIRTTVFLKGCPLSCLWCSNPEGLALHPQVGVYPDKCIGVAVCGFCLKECPEADRGALIESEGRIVAINRSVCTNCLRCAAVCPASNALKVWGRKMTVSEAMKVILSDRSFYEKSGGGLTLSGGEVLTQHGFARDLLRACRTEGIHTCVETTLHARMEVMEEVLSEADFVITDIKHMNPVKHREQTGISNEVILANMERAVNIGPPVIVRIPVVAGYNNDEENIRATAKFILEKLENKVIQIQLMPYRELGTEKYAALGMDYPMGEYSPPSRDVWEADIRHLVTIMQSYGIPAVAGTTVKHDG